MEERGQGCTGTGCGDANSSARPRNLEEALRSFGRVLESRSVREKERPWLVTWVRRFDRFRTEELRRACSACSSSDVVAFLRQQQQPFNSADWQLAQARRAIVLFLAGVMKVEGVDARAVMQEWREGEARQPGTHEPAALVDEEHPEWYRRVQRSLRMRHYAKRTEEAYLEWLERFVIFHGGGTP